MYVLANRWATIVVLAGGREVASWPLWRRHRPDVGLAEELARLQLSARRLGWAIHLREVGPELAELLDLLGLGDVVGDPTGAGALQARGEAEGGEQLGVEEVVQPGDPVA